MDRKRAKADLLMEHLPKLLGAMENRLAGKKYFAGNKISIADIFFAAYLGQVMFNEANPSILEFVDLLLMYPNCKKFGVQAKKDHEKYFEQRVPSFF